MWPQSYAPVAGSLQLSALVAVLPVFVVLLLLGVLRKPAWVAAIAGFIASAIISVAVYNMPVVLAVSSALYGAANGMLPIGWIVFTAILLYRVTVDTGKFDIIKDSLGSVTSNRSMQALLIAFAFGGVHRRRRRFRHTRSDRRRHASRPGVPPVFSRQRLPAGEHRPSSVRIDRHASNHVAARDEPADRRPLRRCRPSLRAARPDPTVLFDAGHGRLAWPCAPRFPPRSSAEWLSVVCNS